MINIIHLSFSIISILLKFIKNLTQANKGGSGNINDYIIFIIYFYYNCYFRKENSIDNKN